jgi:hypothetical protein
VARAKAAATFAGCEELLAFATSALRDADNSAAVLSQVRSETGVGLQVLSGEDEARYTFLAVRRWYGWSAGRLLVLDIGGGSLELAAGRDEDPEVALSLPLGAGRLTRQQLTEDPPARRDVEALAEDLDAALTPIADQVRQAGPYDLAVGTSRRSARWRVVDVPQRALLAGGGTPSRRRAAAGQGEVYRRSRGPGYLPGRSTRYQDDPRDGFRLYGDVRSRWAGRWPRSPRPAIAAEE